MWRVLHFRRQREILELTGVCIQVELEHITKTRMGDAVTWEPKAVTCSRFRWPGF